MLTYPKNVFFSTLILTLKADGRGTLTSILYSTLTFSPAINFTLPSLPNTNLSRVAPEPERKNEIYNNINSNYAFCQRLLDI